MWLSRWVVITVSGYQLTQAGSFDRVNALSGSLPMHFVIVYIIFLLFFFTDKLSLSLLIRKEKKRCNNKCTSPTYFWSIYLLIFFRQDKGKKHTDGWVVINASNCKWGTFVITSLLNIVGLCVFQVTALLLVYLLAMSQLHHVWMQLVKASVHNAAKKSIMLTNLKLTTILS